MTSFIQQFKSVKDIVAEYGHEQDTKGIEADLKGAVIHLAWYGYGCYCGESLVIYEKSRKLYEVNGYHCSCFGLEGQWEPEETSWKALALRELDDECEGSKEATKLLRVLVKERT